MSSNALKAVTSLEDLEDADVSVERLDYVREQLRLIGAVVGLKALLEVAVESSSDTARVSAARSLASLDEDPEDIAARLRSAPWADLSVEELEAMIQTGEVDPERAREKLKEQDE